LPRAAQSSPSRNRFSFREFFSSTIIKPVLNDNSHTYTWDAYGRPAAIDSVTLTYDAFGTMVEQNRSGAYTQFVYSPTGQKMQIMNGQTSTKSIVVLPGGGQAVFNSSGLLYYGHPDHLGSARFASTPSRTISYDGAYAPFGEPYAQSGTADPSFTGQRQDTVAGLYDFPAREYSIQGRWPSPDPAGLAAVDPSNPQSWNRYAYVTNNPLKYTDPSGKRGCTSWLDAKDIFIGDCGGGGWSAAGYFFSNLTFGNDIFDALGGAPGTFLTLNMHGQQGFGFSEDLWSMTQNFLDHNPYLRGSSALK
jgi:RHS repeat-associated protein